MMLCLLKLMKHRIIFSLFLYWRPITGLGKLHLQEIYMQFSGNFAVNDSMYYAVHLCYVLLIFSCKIIKVVDDMKCILYVLAFFQLQCNRMRQWRLVL